MKNRISISISPQVKNQFGPEISWVWRVLLTSIGAAWKEVNGDSSEGIIFYGDSSQHENSKFRLSIPFHKNLWHDRHNLRLEKLSHLQNIPIPLFVKKPTSKKLFSSECDRLICHHDLVFYSFWFMTRLEEKQWSKNKHGFYDLSSSNWLQEEVLFKAPVTAIARAVKQWLTSLDFAPFVPDWPQGKKAAVGLSHDIDYPEVKRLIEPFRIISKRGMKGIPPALAILNGKKNHWHFNRWMELENRYDAKSAFYFSAKKGSLIKYALGTPDPFYDITQKRFKNLFRLIKSNNSEIGLHTSYNAYQSIDQIKIEKELLENCCNNEVIGNRHHYWHCDSNNLDATLLAHEAVGFKYDSSIGHEKYMGWRGGHALPYFPYIEGKNRSLKTLQVSPTWMDDHLFNYLKENLFDRKKALSQIADTVISQGGMIIIDIHNYVYDSFLYPEWKKTYEWFISFLFEKGSIWLTTPGEIAIHWIKRYNSIIDMSQGLSEGIK